MATTTNTTDTVTASNGQLFDVIKPEDMPRDANGDGSGLWYTSLEHDEMMCAQAIEVMDEAGRWAIYEPVPKPPPEKRPQDQFGNAAALRIVTGQHDKLRVPWALKVSDHEGRSAVYQPLKMDSKVVRAQRPRRNTRT